MGKQLRIKGTERTDIPPELDDASNELIEQRREKRRAAEKVKQAQWKVIAVMQANKLTFHKIKDPDTDEYLEFELEMVPTLRVRKTDQLDSDEGEEVVASGLNGDGIHPGLIAQAEKAQADANVEVSADGDVNVPDKAAPKAKRGRKPKNGATSGVR